MDISEHRDGLDRAARSLRAAAAAAIMIGIPEEDLLAIVRGGIADAAKWDRYTAPRAAMYNEVGYRPTGEALPPPVYDAEPTPASEAVARLLEMTRGWGGDRQDHAA